MGEKKPAIKYKYLNVDNVKYKTLLTKKYLLRKPYVDVDDKKVNAFISGGIRKIYVKKGRSISVGDKLLVLEAMKMRNDIISPIDGVIKEIFVKVGDNVSKGQVLIEYK
ncbi:MAG: biotin/lipoyl-binding protein [Bacteroidales bacterium]|nr:biotin/lipoyl-binding protein [Bacteroidales bacterium]MCK4407665.1 biotin/lipoyl-binding protein [Bacteroidales bacterium]